MLANVIAVLVLVTEPEAGGHHREYPSLVGVKYGQRVLLRGAVPTEVATVIGPFFERVLVHRWLELELDLPLVVGHDGSLALPLDLHLKKPFHPSRWWSPYLGVGPTLELGLRPERGVALGISVVAGAYVWVSPRLGFDVDVSYDVVAVRRRPVSGFLVGLGPVWRF